jgi:pimeloyl-ACP methyl ester carboxylesterase
VHVVLAGGPGDSGVNLALGIASRGGALLADIMDGDVVGIDQRGSGMSLPNLSSPQLYDLPLEGAASPDAWLPQMARAARNVADTFRQRGIRLDAYNTRESADDVRDVCRSLGYEKATLWGRSYGTHLALAVLARHPDMVERLVLVGPEGANHTWKLPSQVDTVLERVAERAQTPSLVIDMRRVIAGLAATPVTADISHPATGRPARVTIGSFDVQWVVSQALGDPRMLATLPAAFREMSAGNFQRVAPILLLRRSRLGVESAMKHVMDASSGATADRFERIERESSTAVLGNAINFPGMFLRHAWGAADLGDDFRRPIRSEVPALILAGDLDPRTPVENAREIAATLPNAQVVVIENATHQFDFFGQPAIRAVLGQFLRGGRVANRVALPPIEFQR